MQTLTKHIEASADAELPPSSWADIVSAAETLAAALFPHSAAGLHITTDAAIRALNRLYRGVDEATDVLSFPAEGTQGRGGASASGESASDMSGQAQTLSGANYAGDIALSWDAVLRQAVSNGNLPEAEAVALVAHGFLHLAGYEHDSDAGEAAMDARTRELTMLAGFEVKSFGH